MYSRQPAALQAKSLLSHAARHLHTTNPASVHDLSEILDASMYLPLGDSSYQGQRLLEPSYAENQADSLSFEMATGGPGATPLDRVETTTNAMSQVLKNHFGNEAVKWFDGRSEAVAGGSHHKSWGASFGTALDKSGVSF